MNNNEAQYIKFNSPKIHMFVCLGYTVCVHLLMYMCVHACLLATVKCVHIFIVCKKSVCDEIKNDNKVDTMKVSFIFSVCKNINSDMQLHALCYSLFSLSQLLRGPMQG